MADREFQKKRRNTEKRCKKPVMLITAEGNNKTERLYFTSLQKQHGKYSMKFVKTSKDTDPDGMYKSLDNYWRNNDLSKKYGDKAYIVMDLDCNEQKAQRVEALSKNSENIQFVLSNPCIEVWFLLHFSYSTHQFMNSKEPKRELRKYINAYEENVNIASVLEPHMHSAMRNVERLRDYYQRLGISWGSVACNPMTDVQRVVTELIG